MKVMIGVDPHKGSHTATMLDRHEHELLAWADGVKPADVGGGVGRRDGLPVGPPAGGRRRVGGERAGDVGVAGARAGLGRSTKNDPNDARAVAVAARRAPSLAPVKCADHTTVCRLLVRTT